MAIIKIEKATIEINDDKIKYIKEKIIMNEHQEILIRSKREAEKLSKSTTKSLQDERKKRLKEAIQDNDMLYLNSIFDNVSIFDLLKIILQNKKKYI